MFASLETALVVINLFFLISVATLASRDLGIRPDGWRVAYFPDSWCEVRWRPPSRGVLDGLLYRIIASPTLRWCAALVLLTPRLLVDAINVFRLIDTSQRLFLKSVFFPCWILVMLTMYWWNELTRARCSRIRLEGFPVESLSLVRQSSAFASAERFHLVFKFSSPSETQFIGFPGVSERSGKAIRDEITHALAQQSSGEGERTTQCSGLAITSGGVD